MNIETFDFETLNKDGILIPYSLSYTYDSNTHYHVFEDNDPITISKYILYNFKVGCIYYAHNLLFDFLLFFKGLLSLNIKFN